MQLETSAAVQRSYPSPQQERKASLKRFQEVGFKEGYSGVYRYTDAECWRWLGGMLW